MNARKRNTKTKLLYTVQLLLVGTSVVLFPVACSQSPEVAGSTNQQAEKVMVQGENKAKPAISEKAEKLPKMPIASMKAVESEIGSEDQLSIEFTVKNHSSESVKLLLWGSPLETDLTGPLFRIIRNPGSAESILPYQGVMVKRRAPTDSDYVELASGEQLVNTLALDDSYAVGEPGIYQVEFAPADLSTGNIFTMGKSKVYLAEAIVTVKRNP